MNIIPDKIEIYAFSTIEGEQRALGILQFLHAPSSPMGESENAERQQAEVVEAELARLLALLEERGWS